MFDLADFGASPNSPYDAAPRVGAALRAAERYVAEHGGERAEIHLAAGRYELRSGLTIPSNVSIIGDPKGETVIYFNPPKQSWGQVAISTQTPTLAYIAIARADDPQHPPVPGGSYRGLDFVYLHDRADIAVLRGLGVPAERQPDYAGLKVTIASGATLTNNRSNNISPSALPKAQMEREPGINPTPANLTTIVAVDDDGRVTLGQHSRFDWGRDFHAADETLEQYYHPEQFAVQKDGPTVPVAQCPSCRTIGQAAFISGPGWIVPMNRYTRNIAIENLVIEQDLDRPAANAQQTYLLFLMYVDGAVVRNLRLRHAASIYPLLSVRGFNIDIDNSEFTTSAHASLVLDAGSNYTIRNSRFVASPLREAASRGLPAGPEHFIVYDESPIDVTIVGNRFEGLRQERPGNAGIAIFGTGGSFTRVLDNRFDDIQGPIFINVFYNNRAVVSGNELQSSSAALYSGPDASVSHNRYLTDSSSAPPPPGVGFFSYNESSRTNHACANRGLPISQVYRVATRLAGNIGRDGQPIREVPVVRPVAGEPAKTTSMSSLNVERLDRINIGSVSSLPPNSEADVSVTLDRPAESDFSFVFEIIEGDVNSALIPGGAYVIPAGQSSITVPHALKTYHPGSFKLAARSLCTPAVQRVDVRVQIRP